MFSSGLARRTAAFALLLCAPAHAETPAGTVIRNVAALSYDSAGQSRNTASNELTIIVAERLDVSLTDGTMVAGADATIVASARLTNRGNGNEAFAISADVAGDAGRVLRLAYDADGDGRYDPARDPVLAGGRTPSLAPGAALILFAILNAGTTGTLTLKAAAGTGSGSPGTGFAGAGDGGGDAVTGPTGASASIAIALASGGDTAPTLTKSASISAPDGSTRAVRGATITYTLIARFPTAAVAARIVDPIPAGTAYAPGSLSLDDQPLSDTADGDAGDAIPARIAVALGDQPAGATRTVRFRAVIQ